MDESVYRDQYSVWVSHVGYVFVKYVLNNLAVV